MKPLLTVDLTARDSRGGQSFGKFSYIATNWIRVDIAMTRAYIHNSHDVWNPMTDQKGVRNDHLRNNTYFFIIVSQPVKSGAQINL